MVKISETGTDTYTVYIAGELDEVTSVPLRAELDKLIVKGARRIVFDLADLVFMNSTGVGVFIGKYKKAIRFNTEFAVKNLTKQVEKLFRVSGLFKIMRMAE